MNQCFILVSLSVRIVGLIGSCGLLGSSGSAGEVPSGLGRADRGRRPLWMRSTSRFRAHSSAVIAASASSSQLSTSRS